MRKVTREIVNAFMNDYDKAVSNSAVTTSDGITKMYLFGNLIARKMQATGTIEITLAGWNTNTTRERLNGLPNVHVTQRNFAPYLNGKEISCYDFYTV